MGEDEPIKPVDHKDKNAGNDSAGCDVLEAWVIHGMEHAHPDAPGDGPYTDPLGPDVSAASYDFFSQHALGRDCHA